VKLCENSRNLIEISLKETRWVAITLQIGNMWHFCMCWYLDPENSKVQTIKLLTDKHQFLALFGLLMELTPRGWPRGARLSL